LPKLFNSALIDEVSLSREARELCDSVSMIPSKQEMQALANQFPCDLLTRIYFEKLMNSEHGDFVRRLDRINIDTIKPADDCRHRQAPELIIVPGMFYREHPEVGADGQLIRGIASKLGLTSTIVPVSSKGNIETNVKILESTLVNSQSNNIWLISLSRGSAEVRCLLQKQKPLNPAIQGWLSISGVIAGSPLIESKLRHWPGRLAHRLLSAVTGVSYALLEQLHPEHEFWQPTEWPRQLEMIHVAPIPLDSHIQGKLRRRHRQLSVVGPNDGIVPLVDILNLPGMIYPLWGFDHFCRAAETSTLIYRLLTYIQEQSRQKKGKSA
jgi:hypothetical protein